MPQRNPGGLDSDEHFPDDDGADRNDRIIDYLLRASRRTVDRILSGIRRLLPDRFSQGATAALALRGKHEGAISGSDIPDFHLFTRMKSALFGQYCTGPSGGDSAIRLIQMTIRGLPATRNQGGCAWTALL
jgi:hypothetical protein